ncbi:MAG TPA: hypothetical protein VLE97_09095 [Gaiellaceae bacterium]|nr:hypothetical protein [Gaiellaceae bacterium]
MPNLKNLEAGVALKMKAYLKERGASDADADRRVAAKLGEAVGFVRQKLGEGNEPDVHAAFGQLKPWTLQNV